MRTRIAVLCLSLLAEPAGVMGETSSVRVGDGFAAAALRRALKGARRRLVDPECRRVLSDFTATPGRLLLTNLEDAGQAPEDYLQTILFYDGSASIHCADRKTLAVTTPGSRVVFVCSALVGKLRHGREVEAMVIHEMLHSLGLGEDPPSGSEITAQVVMRCGL
jgi:hypothetical protein